MEQLSATDSMFLFAETPDTPMHIGSLTIFDQSTIPGGGVIRFKDVMERWTEVAHLVPYMRRRVVEVPFNMDFPYWVEDKDFDPEYHIRHVALPAPGDWRQLCIMAARIYAIPLDRSRPLWETWVIEGLNNVEGVPAGSFALLQKMHHACVDGRSATDIGSLVMDPTPEVRKIDPGPKWKPEAVPAPIKLMTRAQVNSFSKPTRVLELLRQTAPKLPGALKGFAKGELKLPPTAPRSRFNGPVSKHRVVDACTWDFSRIYAIKSAAEVTVNDAILAVISGALRRYLLDKKELSEESIVSMCPINVRDKSKLATGGNQVTTMSVALRTDVADAKERLEAVAAETRASKEMTNAIGARAMLDSANLMSARLTARAARIVTGAAISNIGVNAFNTVTTNVPGPQETMYFLGAKLVTRQIGLGISQEGAGLFHAIGSYDGTITVSFIACRDMMPDPGFYAQCLRESFDELEQAVVRKGRKRAASA